MCLDDGYAQRIGNKPTLGSKQGGGYPVSNQELDEVIVKLSETGVQRQRQFLAGVCT